MPELGELCAAAVAGARNGESVEAFAESSRHVQVRVRGGEVEELTSAETRGLGVRAVVAGRVGYAYAADPAPAEIEALVAAARESASFAEPDEANALPVLEDVEAMPGLFRAR